MTSTKIIKVKSRRLDNYSLYHARDAGLASVQDASMEPVTEFLRTSLVSHGFGDLSSPRDIGFSVNVGGITYAKFRVARGGWMCLCDPNVDASTIAIDHFGLTTGYDTNNILTSGFTTNSTLLAPWMTKVQLINNTHPYAATVLGERVLKGFEPPPRAFLFDEVEFGVKHKTEQSPEGRRLIVRWNGFSTTNENGRSFRLKFDVVLYENGRIEFCYGPKQSAEKLFYEDTIEKLSENVAVIIAGPQPAFRDFSHELGYAQDRVRYELGGTVASSYSESGAAYANGLSYEQHWPAGHFGTPGGRFVFAPPVTPRKSLRNDLHRVAEQRSYPVTALSADAPASINAYDDATTIAFTHFSGTYPLGVSRFQGGKTLTVAQRQDLFTSALDVCRSASVIVSSELGSRAKGVAEPFTEDQPALISYGASFFKSSSNADLYAGFIDESLHNKGQVSVSMPINVSTRMLDRTGSIYYYDKRSKRWLMPQGMTYSSSGSVTASVMPSGATEHRFVKLETAIPLFYGFGVNTGHASWIGFNPVGFYATSGSFELSKHGPLDEIYRSANAADVSTLGLTTAREFDAGEGMTFELPIDQPFLLEKAYVRLPLAASPQWHADYTRITTSGTIKFGGPAITFSLFHEQKNSAYAYRNLILSGTITHTADNTGFISASANLTHAYINFGPIGILANGGSPSAVMSSTKLTQSVEFGCEAAVLNGFFGMTRVAQISGQYVNTLRPYFSSSYVPCSDTYCQSSDFVSPLGRAKDTFSVCERSVYGKDMVGIANRSITVNKFNAYPLIDPTNLLNSTNIPIYGQLWQSDAVYSSMKSPYLVRPGDKLIFVASKAASAVQNYDHDVSLASGTLDVTFYGSYVQANNQKPHYVKQQLLSDVVHQVIGDEPVLDQFLGGYKGIYVGTSLDDAVVGTMLRRSTSTSGQATFVTSSQHVFSKTMSRTIELLSGSGTVYGIGGADVPFPNTGSISAAAFAEAYGRLSAINAPIWTMNNFQRMLKVTCPEERYYDTLVPAFTTAFKKVGLSLAYNPAPFDDLFLGLGTNAHVWRRSFPFEPIFNDVTRVQGISKHIVATKDINGNPIDPVYKPEVVIFVPFADGTKLIMTSDVVYTQNGNSVTQVLKNYVEETAATKLLYGFGNSYAYDDDKTFDFWTLSPMFLGDIQYRGINPIIAGWKYGLRSGLAENTTAYWRPDRYGQFRDMLEQRPYSKFIRSRGDGSNATEGVVTVRFLDTAGRTTPAESTWSSNLSIECTSSLPYFDGESRNRGTVNTNTLNQSLVLLNTNEFGNVTI